MQSPVIVEIALPTPLRRTFDYLPPIANNSVLLESGQLVQVPFGRQFMTGVVVHVKSSSDFPVAKLKPIQSIIHSDANLPSEVQALCLFAAHYYHAPLGEVFSAALPTLLRQGEAPNIRQEAAYRLTVEGKGLTEHSLKRAPKQARLWQAMLDSGQLSAADLSLLEIPRSVLNAFISKGLAESFFPPLVSWSEQLLLGTPLLKDTPLIPTREQLNALTAIHYTHFQISLIDGATGSGKTEIYLQAIEKVLLAGKQALVLVPEIGLTPQTIARFQRRFNVPIVALHSGLSDRERLEAWLMAKQNICGIVIGTRSAIFTPFSQLGIIIIDEEHDSSFKQQEGFRYSARDLAAVRAKRLNIPLLMGSATPSLESYANALQGKYQHIRLLERTGYATQPEAQLIDLRGLALTDGFTQTAFDAIAETLTAGNQVLVFLNRRGYAPTLQCSDCGWLADCPHCDARMTLHQHPRHLHCHHCDHQRPVLNRCPSCFGHRLSALGAGTERSEEALNRYFPQVPIIRVDRDSTRKKGAMQGILEQVHSGEPCILIGTQMLAKGHHFPDVTLVLILDADAGLFSTDFRGPEKMAQLLLQVAGRAGRATKPGRVLLQSHHTDHPLVQTLLNDGYHALADILLRERDISGLPPYRYMAIIRAESKRPELVVEFLTMARHKAQQIAPPTPAISYLGPLPAMMEKRGDRYRYLLQITTAERSYLQNLFTRLIPEIEKSALATRVRWTIDIDPLDLS